MSTLKKSMKHNMLFLSERSGIHKDFRVDLSQKKILVGRAPHCDLSIDHESISHYHAMITLDDDSIHVMDLQSHEGVIVNEKYVTEATLFEGDILRIGSATFELARDEVATEVEVVNFDANLEKIHGHRKPNAGKAQNSHNETPPPQGLVLIDDEYCDINFDESQFVPVQDVNLDVFAELEEQYIDNDEETELEEELAIYNSNDSICVTTLVNGQIISLDYLPTHPCKVFASGDYAKGNKVLYIPGLKLDETQGKGREQFITIDDKVTVHNLTGFNHSHGSSNDITLEEDRIFLTKGSLQLVIEKTQAPPKLTGTRFFNLEREFIKEAGKVFGVFFVFMIVLLLIDTSIPEPPKKLAIIYKKAKKLKTPSPKTAKQNPDKKDTDTGIKKKDSPIKEVKFAKKKSSNKKKVAKKANKPAPTKKVAKTKPTKAKKAPVKAYKFSSSKFKSLMKTSNFKAVTSNSTKSVSTTSSSFNAVSNSKSSKSSLSSSAPSKLGSDSTGSSRFSSGAKGLSSKRGFNTIEADPKTVVLGSIDPELLRKILQEYIPQFKYCYQQELRSNEAAEGVIDLSFRILSNGSVSKIKVTGKKARFSRSGTNCMGKVLKIIKFPIPKGGGVVDVKQPLNFVSERGGY